VAHDLSSLVSRLSLSRVGAGGLGLLGIGLTALVTAPTAAAADLGNVTYFCSGSGTVSSSSMAGHVGERFTITPDPSGGDCPLTSSTPGIVTWSVTNGGSTTPDKGAVWNSGHATVTLASIGATTFSIGYEWVPQQLELAITVLAGTGPGTDSEAGREPADVIQQVGMPTPGGCDAVASSDLNWAGVAGGGWAASWAEWPHGGRGGEVCSRTLHYDVGASSWTVL
jgi:hypothetical protein